MEPMVKGRVPLKAAVQRGPNICSHWCHDVFVNSLQSGILLLLAAECL